MRALGLARTAGVALLTYAANALFRLGRWDEAAERGRARRGTLRPTGAAALDVRLARCRITLGRGRLDDAAADLEAVELLWPGRPPARASASRCWCCSPRWSCGAAARRWRCAHVEDGLAVAEAGAEDIWSIAPLVWHGDLGVGRPRRPRGTPRRRRRRSTGCATTAPSWPAAGRARCPPSVPSIEAFSLMCAAEMGRAEQATDPDAWERAAETLDRLQHPYPARLRPNAAGRGAARPPRRAAPTAADVLRQADDLARALGARPLLDDIAELAGRARDLARRCRRPRRRPPRQPGVLDELTARELEVLHELANGFTNREIGQRLYISEKTVGVHVARIFHKIGVHSRVQASAVLSGHVRRSATGAPR